MLENKILSKIFGARETKLQENGESYIRLSYMHCSTYRKNPEMHTEFLWGIRGNETYREAETQMGE